MDATETPDTGESGAKPSKSGALAQKASHRLRNIGAAMASIAAVGAVVGGLSGYWRAWDTVRSYLDGGKPRQSPQTSATSEAPAVAVLTFSNETGDSSLQALATALTQEMGVALTKFKTLRVLAYSAASGDNERAAERGELARRTGADYLVTGDMRKGGDGTRVTISLAKANSGDRVWSKVFDAKPGSDKYLSAQDEIAGRAAAIIGNWVGPIVYDQYRRIASIPLVELTAYECMAQAMTITRSPLPETYSRGRACLESLVAKEPANAQALAALAYLYLNQRLYGIGLPPDQQMSADKRAYLTEKGFSAATKAVNADPNDAFVHRQLAFASALRCDREVLVAEARKAIELDPNDPANYGILGVWISALGDRDLGAEMAKKAIEMTAPETPRPYWRPITLQYFMRGEYREAYETALKYYIEQDWVSHLDRASGHESNGRHAEAQAEIAAVLKMRPNTTMRDLAAISRANCLDTALEERWALFVRRAGLPE